MVCHYWFFNRGLKFQGSVCNCCHDLMMLCLNISDILIIIFKGVNYRCIVQDVNKYEAINLLKPFVLEIRSYI